MADITMCDGKKCPRRNNCYRYRANPTPYIQAYFEETPIKDNKCSYYWSLTKMGMSTKSMASVLRGLEQARNGEFASNPPNL